MESAIWGNPKHSTFRKRYTGLVAVDDLRVRVHKHLQPIVEHALRALTQTDLVVDHLDGYPTHPTGMGVTLRLAPSNPALVALALADYGFTPEPGVDDSFVWTGSVEDAVAKGKALDAAFDAKVADPGVDDDDDEPEPEPPLAIEGPGQMAERDDEQWHEGLPGHRETMPGDIGTDVLFIQTYFGVYRTGIYDQPTIDAVRGFQTRRGLTVTDVVTKQTWQNLVPRYRRRLSPGDGGRAVRTLHSAMIAAGYSDRDEPVRSIFGVLLSRQVRAFQGVAGLAKNGQVRGTEWVLLLSPWQ